jgi:hypothetical protein
MVDAEEEVIFELLLGADNAPEDINKIDSIRQILHWIGFLH